MNSSQGRVKVSWEPPSNSPFVEEKKEKKTPNQYTYAYGGCGAVMATLLGRAAFPLTWTRYWHMALFIFFASLVLPASTSGWFITFSVDIHTPFPEWGGASTSRVILISNNGVEGWAAFPGTRWTKKREPLTFPYFLTIITNVTPQGIPFHVAAEEETLKVARRGSSLPRFQQSFCHCPSGPLFA